VLATVNLLGEGLGALGRRWATARRMSIRRVAQEWGLPLLRAKSTKGFFEGTDWSDVEARSVVLTELADAINRVVALVTSRLDKVPENRRAELSQRCEVLLKIVSEDLEADEAGALHVVRRKTSERLISLTDPEAQHFRKSASQVFAGFKLHVLGDAISGLILSLSVTPGGAHDQTQAHPLIARAKALREDIEEVLGDAAYGGMSTRREVLEGLGVRILAPPASAGSKDKLGKKDFDIDFERMRATCPGGVGPEVRPRARVQPVPAVGRVRPVVVSWSCDVIVIVRRDRGRAT
jgi:IS5 family transposase